MTISRVRRRSAGTVQSHAETRAVPSDSGGQHHARDRTTTSQNRHNHIVKRTLKACILRTDDDSRLVSKQSSGHSCKERGDDKGQDFLSSDIHAHRLSSNLIFTDRNHRTAQTGTFQAIGRDNRDRKNRVDPEQIRVFGHTAKPQAHHRPVAESSVTIRLLSERPLY